MGINMLSLSNWIKIRIWFPKHNGGENVGHVSIETKNHYISLWPPGRKTELLTQIFSGNQRLEWFTLEKDLLAENRLPDYSCMLYKLDVPRLEKKFCELKPKIKAWSLAGNYGKIVGHVTHSCSSLVYDLLKEAGIKSLTFLGIGTNLIPSPHNIFTICRDAKAAELVKYPESKQLDMEHRLNYDAKDDLSRYPVVNAIKSFQK